MPPSSRVAATVHLLPALAAVLVTVAGLAAWGIRAENRLQRGGPALAALNLPEMARGTVLQRRIFQMPNCLPVYGSSEMAIAQPTRADLFFHRERQGFDVVVIGQAGDRCLAMLQELAALGEAVRGRKVVVFLSPGWFLPSPETLRHDHAAHRQFDVTFSPLQTGRLVVDSPLSPPLKRRIAARLLDYDSVIQARSPLLSVALDGLGQSGWTRKPWLAVLAPLVKLQNWTLLFQEQCHWSERCDSPAALRPADSVDRPGDKQSAPGSPREPADQDAEFLRRMQSAPEWNDLELLLETTRQLGIRLLLIDQPINGRISDRQGITPPARQKYYERVGRLAAAYRVLLRDFSADEENRAFFMDPVHPSAEAWVHYDEALAEFFRS